MHQHTLRQNCKMDTSRKDYRKMDTSRNNYRKMDTCMRNNRQVGHCLLRELNLQFEDWKEAHRRQEGSRHKKVWEIRALKTQQIMIFLSDTYFPVRWSSGPPCPPCSPDSPRSVTPLGTGGIFRFSCVFKITVSQLSAAHITITLSWNQISTK